MQEDPNLFEDALALCPLRAGGFIVTVFGDVAFPGRAELGISHLINLCAGLGISETLVRTAVSRLVAAGQLVGTRQGRKSYYALTPVAGQEFARAAQVIYTAPEERPWQFLFFADGATPDRFTQHGMAALTPQLGFGPARWAVPEGAVVFTAHADGATTDLSKMLAQVFALDDLAQDYLAFCKLAETIAHKPVESAKSALQARLLLTHAWRKIALRDPRLPASALPQGHPEPKARATFARAYLALCPVAAPQEHTILTLDQAGIIDREQELAARHAALTASVQSHGCKSSTK